MQESINIQANSVRLSDATSQSQRRTDGTNQHDRRTDRTNRSDWPRDAPIGPIGQNKEEGSPTTGHGTATGMLEDVSMEPVNSSVPP